VLSIHRKFSHKLQKLLLFSNLRLSIIPLRVIIFEGSSSDSDYAAETAATLSQSYLSSSCLSEPYASFCVSEQASCHASADHQPPKS
jgi:hypothetical protein